MSRHVDVRLSGVEAAIAKVTGTLPFVADIDVPGALHAAVVRSTVPAGRITSIDASAAMEQPEVVAVITAESLRAHGGVETTFGDVRSDQPILADAIVRYAGEPVAIVVATDRRTARGAVDDVWIDYDEMAYVNAPLEAVADGAPRVHEGIAGNVCAQWNLLRGDPDAQWASAHLVVDGRYTSPAASHVPLEPHAAIATFTPDRLEVWSSTQAPFAVRATLARAFRLDPEAVVVRATNVGGAFGSKTVTTIEPLVAVASMLTGRPVKLELTRTETFQTLAKHAAAVDMRTAVDSEGRILAREARVTWAAGAYATISGDGAGNGMVRAPGPYKIDHLRIESTTAFTNTVPAGPFRGAMTSQLCWAYERQLDDIAAALEIDPIEIRRRNILRPGDAYATGETPEDLAYDEILDRLEAWTSRPVTSADAPMVRGRGVALMIKTTQTPSRSEARLVLDASGSVTVHAGVVDMGQGGGESALAAAARALDVDRRGIVVAAVDTTSTPYDTFSASSRSAYSIGAAIESAAEDLRARLAALVPELDTVGHGGTSPGDVRSWGAALRARGVEVVEGVGVFQSSGGLGTLDPVTGQGNASNHWHQGGVAVEVEVDRETGRTRVIACCGIAFAGRVIDAHRARLQNEGGMAFALGPAMFEELLYSDGQLINPNLSDYLIPSIIDVPTDVESSCIERPGGDVHGLGEMTVPSFAPAIGNAIRDALGTSLASLPMTAEVVLRAIRDQP